MSSAVSISGLGFGYEGSDQLVLDGVELRLVPGKVHALVGENGAGKSTLFKLIAGMLAPTRGSIDAPDCGLILQHGSLVPDLSVLENFALTAEGLGMIDWQVLQRRVTDVLERVGLQIDLDIRVGKLDVATAQQVELARIILTKKPVMLLDEPSAILDPAASTKLFELIAKLAADGFCIVFSSHRGEEVLGHAQQVHVLRAGKLTLSAKREQLDKASLRKAMFPTSITPKTAAEAKPATGRDESKCVLKIAGVVCKAKPAAPAIDLEIAKGEAVALVGIAGNGQQELADVLMGLTRPLAGEILLAGRKLDPAALKRQGMGRLPRQLQDTAAAMSLTVAQNLILHTHRHSHYSTRRLGLLHQLRIGEHANELIASEALSIASGESEFAWLSGGNQRKLLIARELENEPLVLVGHDVEAGLDMAAIEALVARFDAAKRAGTGMLLLAQDHAFVEQVADRIFLVDRGQVTLLPRKDWQRSYQRNFIKSTA